LGLIKTDRVDIGDVQVQTCQLNPGIFDPELVRLLDCVDRVGPGIGNADDLRA
jgi:hypothetical protein